MNRTVNPEAAPYLDAVRARLSRMPDEEQEDLLADLEQHLSELVTNEAGPLFQQLGSAEEYAAELTHSAGWNDTAFRRPFMLRVSDWAKRVTATGLGGWLWELGKELRPGWWVARGLMVPMIWSALYTGKVFSGIHWVILGLAGSIALGFRARRTRAWRLGSWSANIVAVWTLTAGLLNGVGVYDRDIEYTYLDSNPFGVVGPNGPIVDFVAYDLNGNQVSVYLYDQNGQPVIARFADPDQSNLYLPERGFEPAVPFPNQQ